MSVTSVSRRLNDEYSVGRYAICSATTTSPVAPARKSTTVAPPSRVEANPSVSS
jgi:hypothetical protein